MTVVQPFYHKYKLRNWFNENYESEHVSVPIFISSSHVFLYFWKM